MSVKKLTDGSSSKTDLTALPVSRNRVHLGALAGFILFVIAGVVGVCVVAHITGGAKEMDSRCDPETILSGQRSECLRLATQGQKELCEHCPASKPHRKRSIQQRSVVCLPGQIATDTTNITTTNATPTEKPKLTNYRLPTSLYPTHYNIEIQTYIIGHNVSNFFFKGSVKIWLRCDQPSDNVTLHLNGLEVDESSLLFYGDGSGFNVPKYTNWSLDTDREFFILNLDGYTEAGKTYIIEISYTSPIKKNMKGLYLSSYQRINQTVYLAATQFQPTDARKAFPCFDEPAIKSTFNVTLVRPSNMTSLSNMPIINNATTFTEDGVKYVKDVFAQSKIMSAYLVAFVVSDFSHLQRTLRNGVLFRTWSRPEVIATTEFSLDIGTKMFLYFEEFFDVKYPMPKLDMIPIPDFPGGGMENWGLITYKEKTMLYKEKVTEASEHFNVAVTVAHELAHMWFGNLVTLKWWDDLWLNEGFAFFVMFLGVDYAKPEWKVFDRFSLHMQDAFALDGLVSSHPLYVPVGHPNEVHAIFDTISYKKGGSVIQMMRYFLGYETFRKGMNLYLTSKQYSNASHNDLWAALTEQVKRDNKNINVKEVMDTWILQMNYPLVTVTRDCLSENSLVVRQERFLLNRNATETGKYTSPFNYKWTIPLTFASSSTLNFKQTDRDVYWLGKNETSKVIPYSDMPPESNTSWFICNVNFTGFYRVNYELENWNALAWQLKTDHTVIPVTNRAQLISDAWNLLKSDNLDLETVFSIMDYLRNEREYVPWTVTRLEMNYISQMLISSSAFRSFQAFMQKLLKDSFQYYGMDNSGNSVTNNEIVLARATIAYLACRNGIQECLDASKRLFKAWMDNPQNNLIETDLKPTVYCYAIHASGVQEWDFAYKMYKETNETAEKNLLLGGLSCSLYPWILNSFMNDILIENSPIPTHDALRVLTLVAQNPSGKPLAWLFFRENFQKLNKKFGQHMFTWANAIDAITKFFNTNTELSDLKMFKASHEGQFGNGESAIKQAVEKVEANVEWMGKNLDRISTLLSAYAN